jgi:hypothetical protein
MSTGNRIPWSEAKEMSRHNHEKFPELTPASIAVVSAGYGVTKASTPVQLYDRRSYAALLREAIKQARWDVDPGAAWASLHAIADNLHPLPPPPPTLAEARKADLSTPAGRDLVREFLANLATETQP